MIEKIDERHKKLHALNRRVSVFLRAGTALSLLLLLSGLVMYFVTGTPHAASLIPLPALLSGLLTLSPAALVTAGLVVILAMPPFILLISFAHFIATRETKPVIVCIVLLVMLAASYISVLK